MEPNELYREGARDYVRHADTNAYNARYERPAMLQLIGDCVGLRVIDAGCAGGYYTAALAARAKHVCAIDASCEMIEIVRERALGNVEARVHDLRRPLDWIAASSVDLVVSSLALHYLGDWTTPLAEFARVLRPEGRLVVSVHHPAMTLDAVPDYFATTPVVEQWNVGGTNRAVRFYHRSLESIFRSFLGAGLRLGRILEPQLSPSEAPDDDERRLATKPVFLIVEGRR